MKLLHESELFDLNDFSFEDDIKQKYYVDSLGYTALVSSIEEEFNTVFHPELFKKANSLDVFVDALTKDDKIL